MNEILRYRNIIIGVLIIAVFSLIIYSIYAHYTDQLQTLKAKRLELQKGSETIDRWYAIQNEYAALGRELLRGDSGVFKQFIEEKARASNIYITSLNIGQEDRGFYWKVAMDFEADCFFRDLIQFSRLLGEKKVKIVSIVINKKAMQEKKEGIVLRARLEGVVIK